MLNVHQTWKWLNATPCNTQVCQASRYPSSKLYIFWSPAGPSATSRSHLFLCSIAPRSLMTTPQLKHIQTRSTCSNIQYQHNTIQAMTSLRPRKALPAKSRSRTCNAHWCATLCYNFGWELPARGWWHIHEPVPAKLRFGSKNKVQTGEAQGRLFLVGPPKSLTCFGGDKLSQTTVCCVVCVKKCLNQLFRGPVIP